MYISGQRQNFNHGENGSFFYFPRRYVFFTQHLLQSLFIFRIPRKYIISNITPNSSSEGNWIHTNSNMGVSINGGTPKWMVYDGKTPWWMIWGSPHLWKPSYHVVTYCAKGPTVMVGKAISSTIPNFTIRGWNKPCKPCENIWVVCGSGRVKLRLQSMLCQNYVTIVNQNYLIILCFPFPTKTTMEKPPLTIKAYPVANPRRIGSPQL